MGNTVKDLDCFDFESREAYDRAEKESEKIRLIREKADLTDGKMALRFYNTAVSDKVFDTVAGYCFLMELRQTILDSGVATPDSLAQIPVKETIKTESDTIPQYLYSDKYQKLYEGQKLLNQKFKIALVAMIILLAGFVIINFRFEYSIFTYFTDYKTKMEEEIVDKYEHWESELEEREKKLEQGGRSDAQ
ncbi:MAG: hypothetical protein J1F02_10230 [Lachnospiraceae bacterium]|nr:hypothetical protein [Lachnospiraceae bacterium]